MSDRRRTVSRALIVGVTTVLVSAIGVLALATPASARVSIVPGTLQGGGTETFAVRLANERSDVPSTRLELVFPTAFPIALVEVAPVDGWTATVDMRPLDPPVTVGDTTVDEAVASIVWEGGTVAPKNFAQFLVTAGRLPADGRLVFTAVQGYADDTEDRWTDPAAPGLPGAPTIVIIPDPAAAADRPAGSGDKQAAVGAAPAAPSAVTGAAEESDPTLWILLLGGVLVAGGLIAGFAVVRHRRRPTPPDGVDAPVETMPERAATP